MIEEVIEQERLHNEDLSKLSTETPSYHELEALAKELEKYKKEFERLLELNVGYEKTKIEMIQESQQLNADIVGLAQQTAFLETSLADQSTSYQQKIEELNQTLKEKKKM